MSAAHVLTLAAVAVSFWVGYAVAPEPPDPGVVFEARVERVVDGDTIDVRAVSPVVRVRLLECWAPERSDNGGPEATEQLKTLIGGGTVRVSVPMSDRLSRSFTFGRVLGHVWSVDNGELDTLSLSQRMVESGHATRERTP